MVKESYSKWFSPNLSMDTQMLVFGESGMPVILFPTSKGAYHQNKDFGLVSACYPFLERGLIKIYCVDSVDQYSFYNYGIHPRERMRNHMWYDRMILEEVVQRARDETGYDRVAVGGCSFGGYHAVNFGFRYPHLVSNVISMGGAFDIKQFVFGHYDDNVYFNNPVDFMPQLSDGNIYQHFHRMGIILGTGHQDICRGDNHRMASILASKSIPFWLDDRPDVAHDWPYWRTMVFDYMRVILEKAA